MAISGAGSIAPMTPCLTRPLAVAEPFVHKPGLERAAKARTQINITR
jgi:hypothetical protein